MNKRFAEIARRKQALIEKAAADRLELAAAHRRLSAYLNVGSVLLWGGALLGIGRVLKAYPMIAATISSILVTGLAGKIFKGADQAAKLWRFTLPLRLWWSRRRRRLTP